MAICTIKITTDEKLGKTTVEANFVPHITGKKKDPHCHRLGAYLLNALAALGTDKPEKKEEPKT